LKDEPDEPHVVAGRKHVAGKIEGEEILSERFIHKVLVKNTAAGALLIYPATGAAINAVAAARASSAGLVRIMATRPDSNERSLAI
jgi:hypothetical protein